MRTLYYLFALGCGLALGFLAVGQVHAQAVCPPDWHFSPPCSVYVPPEREVRSVPEPGTLLLVGAGIAALVARRRK